MSGMLIKQAEEHISSHGGEHCSCLVCECGGCLICDCKCEDPDVGLQKAGFHCDGPERFAQDLAEREAEATSEAWAKHMEEKYGKKGWARVPFGSHDRGRPLHHFWEQSRSAAFGAGCQKVAVCGQIKSVHRANSFRPVSTGAANPKCSRCVSELERRARISELQEAVAQGGRAAAWARLQIESLQAEGDDS